MKKRMMLSLVVLILLIVLVTLMVIVLVRTPLNINDGRVEGQCSPGEGDMFFAMNDTAAVDRFLTGLSFPTVSFPGNVVNDVALEGLIQAIIANYTTVHNSPLVKWQRVANYSLLYEVKGTSPDLKPYLLMAHYDVVPVPEGDIEKWGEPPFAGKSRDGMIYGRGAVDDKLMVYTILEALEWTLKRGYKPKRPFYVAFGHDEEVNGYYGARVTANKLLEQGLQFEFIVDEGNFIMDNLIPGVDKPAALIGVSEKGIMYIELSVKVTGGHSSVPFAETSIGIIGNALTRLEKNLHKNMFGTGVEVDTLQHLIPGMSYMYRILNSNLWLFSPIVSRIMERTPTGHALIRTTTASTIFKAGVRGNVMEPLAVAIVNHRVHPQQNAEEVLEHDRRIIADDRIKLRILSNNDPHPVSPAQGFGWDMIKTSITQVWGKYGVVVAPGLYTASTDTKHVLQLSKNIYRFRPVKMDTDQFSGLHGANERVSIDGFYEAINFYCHLIVNVDKDTTTL